MHELRKDVGKTTGKTGRPQVWKIWRVDNKVYTRWGILDGQMQETAEDYEGNNLGRANEKTPEEVAQEDLERKLQARLEKGGWYEVNPKTGVPLSNKTVITEINFNDLPRNLRFAKPNSSPKDKKLKELIENKQAIWTRKRDGMQHSVLFAEDGEWKMYSSVMAPAHKDEPSIPWLQRYPGIHEALKALKVPKRTIFVGELTSSGEEDEAGFEVDSMKYVSEVIKSKFEEAMLKQTEKGYELTFTIFDIPYWGGEPWYKTMEISRRFGAIHELVSGLEHPNLSHVEVFMPGEVIHRGGRAEFDFDGSYQNAMEMARELDWEGFVVYNPRATSGDHGVTFDGKHGRPPAAAKVKLTIEADFVVYWDPENDMGKWGKGKKAKGIGSVQAYLYKDDDSGELIPIALVGGGLSDEEVFKFANPKLYPMVWTIEFMRWTPKGSIREPRFIRVREDKKPEECTTEQMPENLGDQEEDDDEG